MLLLTAALSLAMLAVLVLALREVWQFRRRREVHRLRRLTLRLATAGMLLFLLTSILIGVRVFGLNEPDGVATLWMAFWGCIALLTGGILCLVIADFQTIGDDALQNANQYWDDIAQTIAEHQQTPPKD